MEYITTHREQIGMLVLRFGLAGVYLFFGFSQIFDGVSWVGIVPAWAVSLSHLSPAMLVLGNGVMEVVLGTLLALGYFVTPVAAILSVHLFVIASDFGFAATGIRDYGLALATAALAFLDKKN